jgi:hypothetical protein
MSLRTLQKIRLDLVGDTAFTFVAHAFFKHCVHIHPGHRAERLFSFQ